MLYMLFISAGSSPSIMTQEFFSPIFILMLSSPCSKESPLSTKNSQIVFSSIFLGIFFTVSPSHLLKSVSQGSFLTKVAGNLPSVIIGTSLVASSASFSILSVSRVKLAGVKPIFFHSNSI